MDAGELSRQVCLAEVDELDGGVDFHAQFGDAAIDEAAEVVDFGADGGAHELFERAELSDMALSDATRLKVG